MTATQAAPSLVQRNRCQPGEQARIPAKGTQIGKCARVCLLQHVFRLEIVAYDTAGDPKEPLVAPLHDHTKCRGITVLCRDDNPTSTALSDAAAKTLKDLDKLTGAAFDRAYAENEVTYHKTVNGALSMTLIPNAKNAELKQLLQTGLKLFQEHQEHAEHLAASSH